MIRYLSLNRNFFYSILLTFAFVFAGLGAVNAQSPCGNVSASVGFPNPGCDHEFVAGDFIEVSTASNIFVDRWEYSYDGGSSFTAIPGSQLNRQLPFNLLNLVDGGPIGVVFRMKYNSGCAFGYSNNSGAYSITPKPVAATSITGPASVCSGVTNTYSFTGANFLLISPPSLWTTSFTITPTVTGPALAGSPTFTRNSNTSGTLSINPTNPGATIGTVTYAVYATNGTCAATLIGTVGPICVYPTVSGGSLTTSISTICTGTSINLGLTGFTNWVNAAGACAGTSYSISSNAGTLTGGCVGGVVTDGLTGTFSSGVSPADLTVTPTNTTNIPQTITYTVTITNGPCTPITRTVNVTVKPNILGGSIATGTSTICTGSTVSNTLGGITCANGHGASTTYTIYLVSQGGNIATNGMPVTVTNSNGIFTVNPTNTGCLNTGNTVVYQIRATNGSPCSEYSLGTFTVTVIPALNNTGVTVTSPLAPTNKLCTGSGTTITINNLLCATGYGSGFTSITVSAPSLTGGVTGGTAGAVTKNATDATFTIGALSLSGCATGTASYTITGQNAPCAAITLGTITITVIPALNNTGVTVTSPLTPTNTLCSGSGTTITVNSLLCANGYNTGFTLVTVSAPTYGGPGASILTGGAAGAVTLNANNATFSIAALNLATLNALSCSGATASYTITGQNPPCAAITLGTITINVVPDLNTASIPATSTVCTGSGPYTITPVNNDCLHGFSATTTYTLTIVGSAGSSITNAGTTQTNNTGVFSVNPTNTTCFNTNNTVTYNIKANNGSSCADYNLGNIVFTVNPKPIVNGQTFTLTNGSTTVLCDGANTTITPNNVCAGATYNWELSIDGGGYATVSTTAGAYTTPALTSGVCVSKTYAYRLTVTIGLCSETTTLPTITVYPAISVTTNVAVATACSGSSSGSFDFSGSTISCEQLGATYQLLRDVTPIVTNSTSRASFLAAIASITAPNNYTCANASNNYSIRVTNTSAFAGCTATSSTISTTVTPSPANVNTGLGLIVSAGTSICTGDQATLSVNACAGATLGTWLVSVNGGAYTDISLVVPAITMTPSGGGQYQTNGLTTPLIPTCTQTTYSFRNTWTLGSCSETSTTSNIVTVYPAPTASTISIDGASTGIVTGSNIDICTAINTVIFNSTVPACGTITTWQYSHNSGLTWYNISSSASNTITVTNIAQNTLYRAVISNGALCATTTSNVLSATVNVVNGGTTTASVNPLCFGSSTSITVNGQLGNIIDWQSATASTFLTPASLALTTNPISVSPTTDLWYRAVLASGVCTTYSAPVLITVSPATVGGTITNSAAATQCSPASGTLTLGGATGTVQNWEYSINAGVTWTVISNPTLIQNYSGVTQTTRYRALVKSGACSEAYSTEITVTVYPVTTPTLTISNTAICQGTAVDLTSSVTNATAGVTTYEITSTGATVATVYASNTIAPGIINITPAVGTTNYILTVTTAPCAPVTSTVTVVTSATTVAGTITGAPALPSTQCAPAAGALTLGSNTGTVQQWEYSIDNGSTWVPIVNTTTSHSYSGLTQTTQYRALVKSGVCSAAYTTAVTVTVYPKPTASITSDATAICQGTSVNLTSSVSNAVAGVTTYTITSTGATVATIYSSTTAPGVQTITPAVGTTNYILTVTTAPCAPVTSTVTVVTSPTSVGGTLAPAATAVCVTGNSGTITLSGNTGSVLQWEYSEDGGNTWNVITNTSLTQNYSNLLITTRYRALVKSGICTAAYSAESIITVYLLPTVTVTSANATICNGSGTSITGTATNTVVTVTTYTITAAPGGVLYASSTTAPTFPFPVTPSVTTTYTYTVTTSPCSAVSSSTTVTVIPVPTATINASSPICATSPTVLSLTYGSVTPGLTTYIVTSDYPTAGSEVYATNTTAPNSPLTVDATNINPNGTTTYTFTVTSAPCAAVTVTKTVVVHPVPVVTLASAVASICNGTSTTLSGTATPVVPTVTFYKIGTTSGGGDIYPSSTTAPTFPLTVSPTVTTTYYYSVTNGACSPVIASTTVTVIPVATASVTSPSPICATTSTVLTLATTNTVAGLTTYKITSDYPAAGSVVYATNTTAPNATLTVPSTYVNPNGVTNYTFTVSSAPCSDVTSMVAVTVRPVPTATLTSAAASICNGTSTTITGTETNTLATVTTYAISAAPGGVIYASSTTPPTFPFSVSPTVTTTYTYTVTNGPCAPVTATTTVVVIPVPTASISSPTPICATSSVVLSLGSTLTVSGLTTYKVTSDYPSTGSVVYATNTTAPNSTLTVPATYVNPNGVTNYTYTVTSAPCAEVTASTAVTVHPVPVVTVSAANASICIGTNTTLSGTASPVVAGVTTYKIGTTSGGFDIYGTTAAGLTTAPGFPFTVAPVVTTTYYFTVTNGACSPVTSSVTVVVIPQPVITSFTSTTPICATSSTVLTFGTNTTVSGLTTYKITSNYPTAGSEVYPTNTTAPTSPLTVDATNVNPNGSTIYTYTVTSAPCASTTASFTQTVYPVPTVTLTANDASICNGTSTTLTGTASPVVGTVTTYKIGTTPGGFDIYGTTAAGLTTAPTFPFTVSPTSTKTYYYTVTNGVCSPVAATVTVVVIPQPVITSFTSTTPICATSSTVLTFGTSTTVNGLTTYKITSNYPTTGSEVYATNTTTPTSPFTVDATNVNPNGTTIYTYTVTSAPCFATTANFVQTVYPVPTVTLTGADVSICNGTSTTISGTASPVVSSVTTYKIGTTPGGFDIYGTTAAGLTTAPTFPLTVSPTTTTTYYYTVTNGVCSPVTANVTVTVIPVPTASVTSPSPICATSSVVLTLASTNTVAGLTTYKITSSYPSAGSVVYATNTSAPNTPLTVPSTYVNPDGVTTFTYIVTSAPCGSVTSSVNVTVYPVPVVTLTSANTSICNGTSTTLTGTAINTVAGVSMYTITAAPGGVIYASSTTAPTFPLTVNPTVTTTYTYTVTNSPCAPVSATTTVVVIPQPVINSFTSPSPICATSSTVLTFTTSSTVTGLTTYKITSDYPSAGSEVYATNTTAPTSPLTVDATNVNPNGVTTYTYTVTSAPCAATTANVSVTVHPVPTVTLTAADASICAGTSTTLSGTAAPVVGVTTYKIGTTPGGFDIYGTTIAGVTTAPTFPLSVSPDVTTTYYYTVMNGACSPVTASVTVVVIPVPTASISSPSPICATSTTVLTLSTTNTVAGLTTYKIVSDYPATGSVVYATNTTAPNATLTVPATYVNPNGITNYSYIVTSAPCGSVTASVAVTVHPVPVVTITSADASICNGTSTTLSGTASPVVTGTTTYKIGTTAGGFDIYGTSAAGLVNIPTFPFTVSPSVTTTYYYTVTNGACSPVTASVTIVVIPQPVINTFTSPSPICATTSTVLTFATSSTVAGLTTYKITSNYPVAGSEVYATNTTAPTSPLTVDATNINPNGVTTYTYTVTSAPCGATSASTSVTVHPVPTVTLTAANASICNGTSTTLTGTATPVVGATTYKIGTTPGGFDVYGTTAAGLATAPTFPFSVSPSATTTYYYTVMNGACSPVTASVTVVVIPVPTASVSATTPICATTSTVLTLTHTNTVAGLTTYRITSDYPSAGSVVYATNTSAPNSPFTVPSTYVNPNGVTNYTYTVTSAPCGSVSATFAVTVYPVPTANITLAPNPICQGSTTTLSITVGNAVGGVTTYAIGTTVGGTDISGTTTIGSSGTFSTTLVVTPPVGIITYYLTAITSPCGAVSANTSVTVNPTSVGGTLSAGVIICPSSSNSSTFTLSGYVGTIVKWQQSINEGATWTDITNTLPTYTATNIAVSTLYRVVVQSGVCPSANSSTTGVFVNTNPIANFSNTTVCFNTPPTVFTNGTIAGTTLNAAQQVLYNVTGTVTTTTTYLWTFGDPTSGAANSSTLTNPTHAYTSDGTFTVSLVATTNTLVGSSVVASCSNSTTKSVTVNQVTTADYTNSPVCLGSASVLNISNYNVANIYSVVWGDGTTAQTVTTPPVTRTYTNPGQYSVRLKLTNIYGCSDSITKNVTAWALPIATGVNISNTAPCAGTTITFTPVGDAGGITYVINPTTGIATSTIANAASITSYLWDFGDGNTATTRIATNTYANAGTYTIKLTITNSNGCSQMFTFTATPVTVQPNPVANFSNTTVCMGVNTVFTDLSTVSSGTLTGWSWNFGDPTSGGNNTSTSQNPSHLFTASGTFTVSLTATTAAGCSHTVSKQVTVNPLPLMNFNSSANSACAGSTITFNSTSTITSGTFNYGWRVSDNAGNFNFAASLISANASLIQTFATAGTYNIRLYGTSAFGCTDSFTRTVIINANPTAVIVSAPVSGQICIYESITFTSTGSIAGSGVIAGYLWNFGDGSTSTAANPAAKSYANPGTYTVSLTITNSNGCVNTTTRTVTVNPKPVVNFTANNVCYGYTMNFTDASTTSAGSSYLWNFGDIASGVLNTSTTQNTSHDFTAAGTYSVKLVVTNVTGCKDSITKSVTVWPRPVANFVADTACEGNVTSFVNLSTITSGSMSYMWYFGDAANTTSINTSPTFLYAPGTYSVKLVVTSGFGCIDSIRKSILVRPNPKPKFIVANACLRDAITLDTTGSNGSAGATLTINYGDGTPVTNSLTHTYDMSGTYTIDVTMTDNGCTAVLSKVVTIYDLPLTSFSVSAYSICVNQVDTFSNTSSIASGTIVSNKWEVINSANTVVTSVTYTTNQEFIYAFNTAGIFRVRLTSTSDKGCMDTTTKFITVNALPTVSINSINFKSQAFHACLGTPHEFTSTGSTAGSGTITGYSWDFGDGSFSSSQNPVYTYKSVGTFMVTLTITNSNGCTFSKQQSVVVDPIPDATITASNFPVETCNGTPITLTGPAGAGYTYLWTRSGATIATTRSITVSPSSSGWYFLAVTSGFGCTKVDSVFLTVNPLPVINLDVTNATISKGWNRQVFATVTGSNPTFDYLWTAQDANAKAKISNNTIANPVLTPPNDVASYYFVLTVTDRKGCIERDTVFFTMLDDYNLKPTNFMTPNDDGRNDFFEIQNIETYTDVQVTIFNRWGNVVYQTLNYAANKWNGTYQNTGGLLPDGTYYYIINTGHKDVNGNEVIYKGHVTILRGR